MGCNCFCCCCKSAKQRVWIRPCINGFAWVDSMSTDPADAAEREISKLFEKKELDIVNGNHVVVETCQNGVTKTFRVTRDDVTRFHAKEVENA